MYPGLTHGAIAALLRHGTRRAEADLSAEDDRGRMDRHHEPDRAALRHRPRPAAHQGGAAGATAATRSPATRSSSPPASTTSPRTSSTSCWRASKARRPAPRASRCSSCRSSCVDADGSLGARNGVVLRRDRAQDGHPRQRHLRDELRRRRPAGWSARRTRACNAMFVMMNEARLGVGMQGLALVRGRLPERRGLRQGAPAGPLAVRREGARQAGRSDHRPPRRAPHAADDPRLQRGRPRAGAVDRAARPTSRTARRRRRRAPGGRRPARPADAGGQGRAHRQRLRQRRAWRSRCSAATATSPSTAWSSSCAMRASP